MARTLTAALLFALAACTAPPAEDAVLIDVQAFGDPAELEAYDALVAAFSQGEPDVEVRMVPVPDQDDHYAKLAASFASRDPPDVFLTNFRNFPRFAAAGVIQPPVDVDAGAFFEEPVDAFTWRGELLCVPQNVSSLVVYYNVDAFRGAGLDLPRRGWTYGEFLGAAERLTTSDRHGAATGGRLIRLAPFVWSLGGELTDDAGFALDDEPGRLAIQAFLELGRSFATPTEEELESADEETRFMDGRLAMVFGSRRLTTTFRGIADFRWDVADLPRLDEPASILHSDAYCVSKTSPHTEDAFRFVRFAAGPQGQPILSRTGRIVPSRRDVVRSDAFLDEQAPASADVFIDAIGHLRRTPPLSTWPEIEERADAVLEEAYYEIEQPGATPTDEVAPVLERLDERTKDLFAEAERG